MSACSPDFAPHEKTLTESSLCARSASGQVTKRLGKKTMNFDINGIASRCEHGGAEYLEANLVGREDGALRAQ